MKTTPLVSIGMPTFNGERFIRHSLDALLAQTEGDFELIISDNGSTDGTSRICKEYASRDSRIRYSRNGTNIGILENYNRVAELARGEFFMFATDDDLPAPTYLAKLLPLLRNGRNVNLAYSNFDRIDEAGAYLGPGKVEYVLDRYSPYARFLGLSRRNPWPYNYCLYYLWRNPYVTYGLFRRSAIQAALPYVYHFYPDCRQSDLLFILKFIQLGNHIDFTGRVLWHYREKERKTVTGSARFMAGGVETTKVTLPPDDEAAFCAKAQAQLGERSGQPTAALVSAVLPQLSRLRSLRLALGSAGKWPRTHPQAGSGNG